jgi:hypothetical protein
MMEFAACLGHHQGPCAGVDARPLSEAACPGRIWRGASGNERIEVRWFIDSRMLSTYGQRDRSSGIAICDHSLSLADSATPVHSDGNEDAGSNLLGQVTCSHPVLAWHQTRGLNHLITSTRYRQTSQVNWRTMRPQYLRTMRGRAAQSGEGEIRCRGVAAYV